MFQLSVVVIRKNQVYVVMFGLLAHMMATQIYNFRVCYSAPGQFNRASSPHDLA